MSNTIANDKFPMIDIEVFCLCHKNGYLLPLDFALFGRSAPAAGESGQGFVSKAEPLIVRVGAGGFRRFALMGDNISEIIGSGCFFSFFFY